MNQCKCLSHLHWSQIPKPFKAAKLFQLELTIQNDEPSIWIAVLVNLPEVSIRYRHKLHEPPSWSPRRTGRRWSHHRDCASRKPRMPIHVPVHEWILRSCTTHHEALLSRFGQNAGDSKWWGSRLRKTFRSPWVTGQRILWRNMRPCGISLKARPSSTRPQRSGDRCADDEVKIPWINWKFGRILVYVVLYTRWNI